MSNHDRFDLIARTAGLLLIFFAFEKIIKWVLWYNDLTTMSDSPGMWMVYGLTELALGILLVRGAIPIADWAYPYTDADDTPEDGDTTSSVNQ